MTLTNHSHEAHETQDDDYDDAAYEDTDSAWTRERALLLLVLVLIVALLLVFGVFPLLENLFHPHPEMPPLQPPVQV